MVGDLIELVANKKHIVAILNLIWPKTKNFKMLIESKIGLYRNVQLASYLPLTLAMSIALNWSDDGSNLIQY